MSMKGVAGQDGPQLPTQAPGWPPLPSPREAFSAEGKQGGRI